WPEHGVRVRRCGRRRGHGGVALLLPERRRDPRGSRDRLRVREPRRLVLRDAARRAHRARGLAGRAGASSLDAAPFGARRVDLRRRARGRARPRHAGALKPASKRMAAVPSARKAIVYLHGFISSPRSRKATMLGDYVANCVAGIDYVVPELHHRPARAIEQAHAACAGRAAADLTLVGSSLGGFYATVMAQRLGCRAALLNPAVHPQRHFGRYLGRQRNLYTGEEFELTVEHVDELLSLDPPAITRPERYWLLVETG